MSPAASGRTAEPKLRLARTLGAALGVLAAISGCGGGGDDSSTDSTASVTGPGAETAISQVEYTRRADVICADAANQFKALQRRFATQPLADNVDPGVGLTRQLIVPATRIYAREAERMRALPPSSEDSEALDTYVGLFDVIETLLAERVRVGLAMKLAETRPLEIEYQNVAAEQAAIARDSGLDGCAFEPVDIILQPSG